MPLLRALLGQAGPFSRQGLEQSAPAAFGVLFSSGVLRTVARIRTVACEGCEADYRGAVRFDRVRGWRRHCLCCGWIPIDEAALDLVAFDRTAFLRMLATLTNGAPRLIKLYAEGRLARIPDVRFQDYAGRWPFAYADGLENEAVLDSVIQCLARDFPDGPGILVTPSRVARSMPLPRGYFVVALDELFTLVGAGVAFNAQAAEIRLGRRKPAARSAGRPSSEPTVREIWLTLWRERDFPSGFSAQADAVLRAWPEGAPHPPTRGTVAKMISKRSATWREETA